VNPGTGFQVQLQSTGVWIGTAGGLSFFVYDVNTGAQILDGDNNSFQYVVSNPVAEENRHKCQFGQCSEEGQDECLGKLNRIETGTDISGTVADGNYGYGAYQSGCSKDSCSKDKYINVVMYWKDKSTSDY
jgi:hypothetical protein